MNYRYGRNGGFCPTERTRRSSPSLRSLLALLMLVPKTVSSLVIPPHDAFFVQWQSFTRLRSTSSSSDYLSSIGAADGAKERAVTITAANATYIRSNDQSQSKRPAFPRSAYYLAGDEERLEYNFISFIDHSFGSSYSQVARLIEPRFYARADQFRRDMADVPPTIDDVAPPPSLYDSTATFLAWNRLPARAIVGTIAYFSFPLIISFLSRATQNVEHEVLKTLVDVFLPGVSIVLGTYFSLTLVILHERFSRMQQIVTQEAGLLTLTFHSLVDLFCDDADALVEGVQCIADQIATLVRESRGRETMRVIYSDPYARILRLVKDRDQGELDSQLVAEVRNSVGELFRVRSQRMSDEALALAPAHFDVMTFISGLLLTGFALGTVATAQTDGMPSGVSRILFSALVVSYVIFYEMSYDLNRPFDGIYQIRRSGAAMHFLQVKHAVSNHPALQGRIEFEHVPDEEGIVSRDECVIECNRRKSKIWYN